MAVMMMREAINLALHEEMERNSDLIVLGEDVVGGMGTAGGPESVGGVWRTTTGLYAKYGTERVIDTPISESAIIGAAAGAALTGQRVVAELMFADFVGVCMDQIWNQVAKFRYMFGGRTRCPLVIRMTYGAGVNAAAQHSQSPHAMLTAMPGLKVAMPTNPHDAKGMLLAAIRDDDPVIFMEHKALYNLRGEVPEHDYIVPLGHAQLVREGGDVTIVACGQMVGFAARAADALAQQGIACDVLDLRSTSPLDEEAILDSIEQTGRLVVVDEAPPRCGIAADIAALAASKALLALKAPVELVTPPHTPVPFARELERAYLPQPEQIEAAVRRALGLQGA